jgi:hypothetical protein
MRTIAAQVSLITSSTVKTKAFGVSFASSFSSVPSIAVGVFQMDALAGDVMEFTIVMSSLTKSNFSISYTVGSSTVINLQSMYYIAIDSGITTLGTYCGASFSNYANSNYDSNVVSLINQGSGYRQTYRSVNFTANTG